MNKIPKLPGKSSSQHSHISIYFFTLSSGILVDECLDEHLLQPRAHQRRKEHTPGSAAGFCIPNLQDTIRMRGSSTRTAPAKAGKNP